MQPGWRGRVRWKGAALTGALLLFASAGHAERQCLDDAPVCLDIVQEGGLTRFVASNGTARPWSFRIALSRLRNLEANVALPIRAVIAAGEERTVGMLAPVEPDRPTGWKSSWGAAPGSMLARPDPDWRYRMPFGGDAKRVLSQGVGGRFSHSGSARYSFDFDMPAGTPVLAARGGLVVAVHDGYQDSGRRKLGHDEANAVEVLHVDGTVGVYSHLRKGIPVEVGDVVATGQRIASSGDSGYTTGPHLHFMVWRRLADLTSASVAVRFEDGSPRGFVPQEGVAYAPACSGHEDGCGIDALEPLRNVPARRSDGGVSGGARRDDGACECANGAVIHVALPCSRVCGR